MANLSSDGTAFDMVSNDQRANEIRMGLQTTIKGIERMRLMFRILGISDTWVKDTGEFRNISEILRENFNRSFNQFIRSSSPPGMGTQIRGDDC